MTNRKMIVYKESFFTKLKNFLINIFFKKDKSDNKSFDENTKIIGNLNVANTKESSFAETLRVDTSKNNEIKNKNILEVLNNNEEALNMLSIDRLKKLEEYYGNIIIKNNEKISRLKNGEWDGILYLGLW